MYTVIQEKVVELGEICDNHRVRRLELFGSAATEQDFDPRSSDLDFLVEFLPSRPGEYADTYFSLLEALQELFGHSVDLVMVDAVKNPYFLQSLNRSRVVLYAT